MQQEGIHFTITFLTSGGIYLQPIDSIGYWQYVYFSLDSREDSNLFSESLPCFRNRRTSH